MSEQLTATVIIMDGGQYILCAGSYIRMEEDATSKTTIEVRAKLEERDVLKWGEDVDEKTGLVNKDVILNSKTELANYLYGRKCLYKKDIINKGNPGKNIKVTYHGKENEESGQRVVNKKNKEVTTTLKGLRANTILDDLKEVPKMKGTVVHLLYLWGGKTGEKYKDVQGYVKGIGYSLATEQRNRDTILEKGYMLRDGIEFSGRNNYDGWLMKSTKKGDIRYKELVEAYIQPDKQAQYLEADKDPYEDELKLDSVLGYINRMVYHEDIEPEERLGRLPQHNRDFLMGVLAYYQVGMGEHNIKDDLTQALNEVYSKDIFMALEQDIRYCLNVSEDLLQADSTSDEHKKNVNALTRMLGLVEEMVSCNMSEKK